MSNTLISTKFYIPTAIGRLTQRPRLEKRLDESLLNGSRLVLVTAPAGFGKSTLVSAWICRQETQFSWLSLDRNDNDPKQFLSYFLGALQKIDPSLGQDQVNRIQTADSADSQAVYMDIMTRLVNEISNQMDRFILVLDDCHLLNNPNLLRIINFLIENQPKQMNMILITREDLPLPISRLRVRRQIIEVRQSDLQFSNEEASDFLINGMGISQLTEKEITALGQRTEGWIAGLQLAGLSIKNDPDPSNFIKSFTGSDRYVLDYLMEEVFTRQPEEIQKFLLATSVLDRFCAPLCDSILAVLDDQPEARSDRSRKFLDHIEHSNLFLIPLDNKRNWYRFHHLFADLLRHFLHQDYIHKIPSLHLYASQWLESNGLIQEAVKHAFQTKDWIYTADMVERHAWNMILHSQVGTVSEWCNTFPEEIIRNRPALCIFHGWALIIRFKKEDIPATIIRIEQAEAALLAIQPDSQITLLSGTAPVNNLAWVTGQLTLLRSFILMMAPRKLADPQGLIDLGQQSYDQLPAEDITGRSVGLLDISYASQARSDAEDSENKFAHVVGIALRGGNYFGAVVAEYHRAHGLFTQGKLREVVTFCQMKRKMYENFFEHPLQELPAIALLDQAQGCALLEMNELAEAEQLLRSGLEVGQWMPREELPGYLAYARIFEIKNDLQGMREVLRRLDMRWPDISYCSKAVLVLSDLMNDPDDALVRKRASAWALENVPEIGADIVIPGIGPAWNDEADYAVYTIWIRIQIMLGKTVEALGVIEPMLEVAIQHKLAHRVIGLSLLQAQAFYVQGQRERAWKPLRSALSLAENNGYLRLVDHNPILTHLLMDTMKVGIAPNFIQQILQIDDSKLTFEDYKSTAGKKPSQADVTLIDGLIEPLSSREIEVLKFMATGLTTAEIAARLYLSPNTLKSHTQNIFSKLDVHSRVQAVNKARELDLI